MTEDFLTTRELAKRWNLKIETVKKWRGSGKGPLYHKLGGIRYNLEDIEEFEKVKLRSHTSMPEPAPTYLSKIANFAKKPQPFKKTYAKKKRKFK